MLPSTAASMNVFRGSFHELLYTLTYVHLFPPVTNFQLLPQDFPKGPPTSVRTTSMKASTNLHGSPFTSMEASMAVGGSPFTSMEASMAVGGSRFTSMEISMEVGGSVFTSMEVIASFHGNMWTVEASIASIDCSFHEYIPWKVARASMYPYILPSTSKPITKLPGASTRLTLTLTLSFNLSWSYLHGSWPTFTFHGSRWKYMEIVCYYHGSWSYLHGSWPFNFHGSWWKLSGSRCR